MSIVLIGQGAVKISVLNNNIAKINETNWELTSNNTIKNKARNEGIFLSSIKVKKGQKIRINLIPLSKPVSSTTLSSTVNGKAQDSLCSFIGINSYTIGVLQTREVIAEKDCEIGHWLWGNANSETFEFQYWAELDTVTNYNKYTENSKVLNIQQEMLKDDCFEYDETTKKWYEVHNWEKKTLNGLENWINTGNTKQEKTIYFAIACANDTLLSTNVNCISNKLKAYTADYLWNNEVEGIAQSKSQLLVRINKEKATDIATFKTYLASNNITAYCNKSTPLKLECTAEQTEVLNYLTNKIKTYKNITNITTDSIALIDVTYKKDTETINKKQDDRIKALEEYIATIPSNMQMMYLNGVEEEIKREMEV